MFCLCFAFVVFLQHHDIFTTSEWVVHVNRQLHDARTPLFQRPGIPKRFQPNRSVLPLLPASGKMLLQLGFCGRRLRQDFPGCQPVGLVPSQVRPIWPGGIHSKSRSLTRLHVHTVCQTRDEPPRNSGHQGKALKAIIAKASRMKHPKAIIARGKPLKSGMKHPNIRFTWQQWLRGSERQRLQCKLLTTIPRLYVHAVAWHSCLALAQLPAP